MKKTVLVALAAVAVVSFQSCRKTIGSGPSVTKTYSVTGFSSIDAGIDGDVYYTQDSNYKVEIYAQSDVQDVIETPVVGGELRLQFKKFANLRRHGKVVVYVSSPNITGLGVNGSGNVYASAPISSTSIALKVNGSGNLSVTSYTGTSLTANISGSGRIAVNGGSVRTSELRTSGSGDMDLLGMMAEDVTIHTSGSGNTSVSASNSLDVNISGSGSVYYRGNPSVYTVISGSGRVSRM